MPLEFEKIDARWRNIITTIPIVDNFNEFVLLKYLVTHQTDHPIATSFPYIYAWEYPFNPRESREGKCDLILTNGDNGFLIVEFKYLSSDSGTTARTKRNEKRKKVQEQTEAFQEKFRMLYPQYQVEGLALTNEDPFFQGEHFWKFLQEEWERIIDMFQIPRDITLSKKIRENNEFYDWWLKRRVS